MLKIISKFLCTKKHIVNLSDKNGLNVNKQLYESCLITKIIKMKEQENKVYMIKRDSNFFCALRL